MSYETITWETADGVGRLTLDRPEHRNGITGVMMNELLDATRRAAADESLRVVVLTGAGSSFCVGADLKHYSSGADDPGAPLETFDVTRLLHEMPAVTIAAINGAAAGAGFGWACACDLRFATASAVFNSAFLDVAVAGDMAGPWSLPRLVGAAKARELYFMPGRFDADEAKRIGLVIDVFDDDRFAGEVEQVVDRLAAAAPLAIRGMKANFLAGETMTLADRLCASYAGERAGAELLPIVSPGFSDSHWIRERFGTIAYGFAPVFHTDPDLYLGGPHAADEVLDVADLVEMTEFHLRALRSLGFATT